MFRVEVRDHRPGNPAPIRVTTGTSSRLVRVRCQDSLSNWTGPTRSRARDAGSPDVSEVGRYDAGWHTIGRDGDDFVVTREAERLDPDRQGLVAGGGEGGFDHTTMTSRQDRLAGRRGLGTGGLRAADREAEAIRTKDRAIRAQDAGMLKRMNASAKALWANR
jgi:hypothetical protein